MRIAVRISLAFGILVLLPVLLAVAQAVAVSRLQNLGGNPAGFRLALASLQMMRSGDRIEADLETLFERGGQDAISRAATERDNFAAALEDARAQARSEAELRETERLTQFWREFVGELDRAQSRRPRAKEGGVPPAVAEHLDRLQVQLRTVYQVGLDSMADREDRARLAADRTRRWSWIFAAAVLVAGGFTAFLIVRSLILPLGSLAEGTRAIAEGKSYVRLDTSRSDELAQIAKDFNTLVERLGSGQADRERSASAPSKDRPPGPGG